MSALLILYLKLIAGSLIGMGVKLLRKNQSLEVISKKSNIEYVGLAVFLKNNFMLIAGTLMTISLIFLILGDGLNSDNWGVEDKTFSILGWVKVPLIIVIDGALVLLFSFAGWVGIDLALSLFSLTGKKLEHTLDIKTNQLDEANGTMDTPTKLVELVKNPANTSDNLIK